jgi:hypothetical protein
MSDFTKDELEYIENGLGWLCQQNPCHTIEIGKLMTKVDSMIDSYCEHHESDGYDYFKIAENEMLMDVLKKRKPDLKCKKCGVFW